MVSAIVMASGLSRRMGQNKLLMMYKGRYIIQHLFDVLKGCRFDRVVVVSCYDEIISLCDGYGFLGIKNYNSNVGQSESIKLGIRHCDGSDGYMFFVGDQPLLDCESINKMIYEFAKDNDYVIRPMCAGKSGNPTIIPKTFRAKLLGLEGDEGGRAAFRGYDRFKYVDVCKEFLFDVDTIEDFEFLNQN